MFLSRNHQKIQWSRGNEENFFAQRTEATTPTILKHVQHRGIEEFLNCAPMFLFFISMKLKTFRVTQNETPKMGKNSSLLTSCYIFMGHADTRFILLTDCGFYQYILGLCQDSGL